jgi:hypothetical protein
MFLKPKKFAYSHLIVAHQLPLQRELRKTRFIGGQLG